MIQDIVDELIKFIDPKKYSLLSKRCRDRYFTKYGVLVKTTNIPRTDILLKYRLKYVCMTFLPGLDWAFIQKYSPEEIEKICSNIITYKCKSHSRCGETDLNRLDNLEKYVGIYGLRTSHGYWQLGQYHPPGEHVIENTTEYFSIPKMDIKKSRICIESSHEIPPEIQNHIINLGCKVTARVSGHNTRIITHLHTTPKEWDVYPRLVKICYKHMSVVPNIIASSLEEIKCKSIFVIYGCLSKYPTIKKIPGVLIFNRVSAKFEEAYKFIYDFDFDLEQLSGLILERTEFDKLVAIENNIRSEKNVMKKRRIRAVVNFVFSEEDHDLFDLSDVITIAPY
jgi:hypothetical protein